MWSGMWSVETSSAALAQFFNSRCPALESGMCNYDTHWAVHPVLCKNWAPSSNCGVCFTATVRILIICRNNEFLAQGVVLLQKKK